jgi:hypothetical protein
MSAQHAVAPGAKHGALQRGHGRHRRLRLQHHRVLHLQRRLVPPCPHAPPLKSRENKRRSRVSVCPRGVTPFREGKQKKSLPLAEGRPAPLGCGRWRRRRRRQRGGTSRPAGSCLATSGRNSAPRRASTERRTGAAGSHASDAVPSWGGSNRMPCDSSGHFKRKMRRRCVGDRPACPSGCGAMAGSLRRSTLGCGGRSRAVGGGHAIRAGVRIQ